MEGRQILLPEISAKNLIGTSLKSSSSHHKPSLTQSLHLSLPPTVSLAAVDCNLYFDCTAAMHRTLRQKLRTQHTASHRVKWICTAERQLLLHDCPLKWWRENTLLSAHGQITCLCPSKHRVRELLS